ncbi:MAG: hypothetical protein C4324_10220 [Blastocatellia bacterium]
MVISVLFKFGFSPRRFFASTGLLALIAGQSSIFGQIIPVSDVTGSSSVFILRSNFAPGQRRFVSSARPSRPKSERLASARRVNDQYTNFIKTNPRRIRTTSVDPKNLPPDTRLKQMPREEASKLFSGVGEYYMDRNDYDNAIDFFREALSMKADNKIAANGLSEALALKGNDLLVKDNFPIAKTFFEEALKFNEKNAPAYFGLAEVLTELGNNDEAIAYYEKALKTDKDLSEIYTPLGALYYQKGEIAKADDYLTRAASISPNDSQAQHFLGLVRLMQNRNTEALATLAKAAELNPSNAETQYFLGEALVRANRPAEATAAYERATRLKPNYFEAFLALGSAKFTQGDYKGAIEAFTQATRLQNTNPVAFNNLADAYMQLPDYNQAEANYSLAAMFTQRKEGFSREDAADMYSKAAFAVAKQCEVNIAQRLPCRWDAAVSYLEQAAKLGNLGIDTANLGWAYYNAARADLAAGRPAEARPKLEKAKVYLQQAVEANSAGYVTGALLNYGMALSDLGEYSKAVDALTKVVKAEPKWAFAINELGIAYRKQDKFKEAIEQFKKAISVDKNFAAAYFNLAESQFRSGNIADARKSWEALRKMGRNDLAAQLDLMTKGALRK